jgi:hypothetical protein
LIRRGTRLLCGAALCGTAAWVTGLVGCGGVTPETGVTAYLRIANAQFAEGALPPDTSGTEPAVRGITLLNTAPYPGQENFPVSGSVEGGGSVLIGLGGDAGHWIVPAPLLDTGTPNNYDFSAQLTFSPLIPMGNHALILRGVAADGTLGPAQVFPLSFAPAVPTGALVVTLAWDTQSDMDLHVVVPNPDDSTTPIEIWSKAPVGLPLRQPGEAPPDSDQIAAAGYLDFDSNAACAIDGRRQENVIFTDSAPSGTYTVRVDAFSLCGQADAQWQVTAATPAGPIVSPAIWEATDTDTRGNHGVGAGRLAFTFSIP